MESTRLNNVIILPVTTSSFLLSFLHLLFALPAYFLWRIASDLFAAKAKCFVAHDT